MLPERYAPDNGAVTAIAYRAVSNHPMETAMQHIDRIEPSGPTLVLRLAAAAIGIVVTTAAATAATPIANTATPDSVAFTALQATSAAARNAVERGKPNQQGALRYLAYVALAQQRVLDEISPATARNPDAVAAALWRTTARITDDLLPNAPIVLPSDVATIAPAPVAERVAQQVLERASTDGFSLPFDGAVPKTHDQWQSQLEPSRPPVMPRLGEMKTYYLAHGSAARPPAPPAIDTPQFRRALDELKQIAAARTDAQVATAKFWEMTTGSLVAGYWQQTALELAAKHRVDARFAARAASAALLATLDANIACHDAKYAYWTPRPSQVEPMLKPIIALPNHPSYPSNHACDSGAAALVLAQFYPAERARLEALALEAGESRLYGGIHYRFDADAGFAIARAVAGAVARREGMAQMEGFELVSRSAP
jgi:hypothetical protein